MDQLASMRIFLAVAEAAVLKSAARQLGLSPSAFSKHIAALEKRLGIQLFTRTTRVRGNIMADNGDTIIRAVMNDGGIAMLPNYMTANYLRDESLTTGLDLLVMEDHPIHTVTEPSRHSMPKIDAFLPYLRSLYQPVPYWDALDPPPSEAARRANI